MAEYIPCTYHNMATKYIIFALSALGIIIILFFGYDLFRAWQEGRPEFDFSGVRRPITYSESPTRGAKNAQVVLYEYADFNCPGCTTARTRIEQVLSTYSAQVQLVWKDFPFISENSETAAVAARCAHTQGKFWEYHDWLFTNQSPVEPLDLSAGAQLLGLDSERFTECLSDAKVLRLVSRDFAEARALGIDETPTIVIGGVALVGVVETSEIEQAIKNALQQ
jgi:protein-disulfide isomerase